MFSNYYVDIDGYSLNRRDRNTVCIYVKDILLSRVYYSSSDFEVIWVKVCWHGYCFFIAACYHPPNPKYNLLTLLISCVLLLNLLLIRRTVQFLLLLVILIYCVFRVSHN